jgi:hypothetical protein
LIERLRVALCRAGGSAVVLRSETASEREREREREELRLSLESIER